MALVDGLVGGVPGQGSAGVVSGECPSGGVLEAVVGLAQDHEVVQAGGPALAPGGEMVDVAAFGGGVAGGEDAGPVAGAHQVGQAGRGTVAAPADVQDGAACRVGDQASPGPASCQGPGSQGRHHRAARPDAHLSDPGSRSRQRDGRLGDGSSGARRGGLGDGSGRVGFGQTPPAGTGQGSPCRFRVVNTLATPGVTAAGGAVSRWSQTNQACQGDGDLDVDVDVLGQGEVSGA